MIKLPVFLKGVTDYPPSSEYFTVTPDNEWGPGTYWLRLNGCGIEPYSFTLTLVNRRYSAGLYTWAVTTPASYSPTKFETYYYNYSTGSFNTNTGDSVIYTAISSWEGGWSYHACYFDIELYLYDGNLCDSVHVRLSDQYN